MTNPDGDKENPVADSKLQPSTRLYVILARKASMGVVFRRGPSKHILLSNWNVSTPVTVTGVHTLDRRIIDDRPMDSELEHLINTKARCSHVRHGVRRQVDVPTNVRGLIRIDTAPSRFASGGRRAGWMISMHMVMN